MGNIFSGLEAMGLQGLSEVKIYEEEKVEVAKKQALEPIVHTVTEEELIFDKKITRFY